MAKNSNKSPKIIDEATIKFIESKDIVQLTQWSQDPACANAGHYVDILGQYEAHISGKEGESLPDSTLGE
ncbi:hypothetical protein Megvenef_00382 [Candidatus Megaera venefica]|uniref:Uncharacterized protein n=1 Tax=Candidatus Megaera venefica TaxID=2055910 RepID=A0ABU5NB63_9RICK|nr:hypothetical protein [Candidatus Megaera venefica]MEA0970419.1 hypothetical protein [Candidatus Megaera venefica]